MLNVRLAIPPPDAPRTTPPGIVSSYLFSLEPGDCVTIAGPYGHFFAQESDREMVFIGGGAGMAPLRSHIVEQLRHRETRRTITFWYGARSREDVFYQEEFNRLQQEFDNFRWTVALSEPRPDDDWSGPTGFIHEVVYDRYLKQHPAPEECEYYLCGPPMMSQAVLNMLDSLGVEPESIFFDDFGA
jgi:Na+-transporting NADH:ubiquinone oxidoreductase subunit F